MNAARFFRPRGEAFDAAAQAIYAERSDLRAAFGDPDGLEFTKWLSVNAALEYPERMKSFFPPVPPEALRKTSSGGEGEHSFLYTGAEDWHTILDHWDIYGDGPFDAIRSMLDFGCGAGRMIRWARIALPRATLRACDVRQAQIAWCREHLGAEVFMNGDRPPLPLESGTVDLTLALSLFSHFDAELSRQWMTELARVTRPGGLILATAHGAFALAVLTRSAEHRQALGLGDAEAREDLRRLREAGHIFHALPSGPDMDAKDLSPSYGNAFLTESWAERNWGACVEILGYVPVRFWFFQDVFVLRPRRVS